MKRKENEIYQNDFQKARQDYGSGGFWLLLITIL